MKVRRAFLLFSGTAALWLSGLLACRHEPSWRDYQAQYASLTKMAPPDSGAAFPPAEMALVIPALNREDRCTSCHVAMQDLSLFGQPNPLQPHPGEYLIQHPPARFGCTICHGGNGKALEGDAAHGGDFRKGQLVEIACANCHREESLPGAPNVSRGKALLRTHQCTQCHYIRGLSETEAFRPAPRLTGLGDKVNDQWLRRWLTDPKSYLPNARMPKYEIDAKYIDALIGYLMRSHLDSSRTADYPEGDPARGKGTLRLAFCITCHPFNGKGGKDAPDLGRIGNKVREGWIAEMLADPHRFQPKTPMPQYNLTPQQMSDIAAYLMDEFTDYDLLEQDDTTKVPVYWPDAQERAEIGRKVYKELRCANCHGVVERGDEWMRVGPDLSTIGDRPVEEIDFGLSNIPRTLPDYLFEKIRNPQAFATATNLLKMPKYELGDDEVKDMVLALLSFNSDTVSALAYRAAVAGGSPSYKPSGEFGRLVSKFRCLSCHSFKGQGHNITYDLTLEGSRVTRDWLYNYLKLSYTIRPILTIRMPIFNMTDEEARILTEGIMRDMVNDTIPRDLGAELTPELAEEGRALFERKGCLACHQVGTRGGYVGPSFTQGAMAGDKLQPGWIFTWLKNPQAIKPDVLEPNYGLSDREALALTAYLMSFTSNRSGTENAQTAQP